MGWHQHTAGPRLIDKIDNERALKRLLDIDPPGNRRDRSCSRLRKVRPISAVMWISTPTMACGVSKV
jgi:hypothetical protein